jgi:hypothetical protein
VQQFINRVRNHHSPRKTKLVLSFARNISTRVLINITIALAALIKNPFRSCSITVGVHFYVAAAYTAQTIVPANYILPSVINNSHTSGILVRIAQEPQL